MCAIAGFFSPNTTQSKAQLHVQGQKMNAAIAHRGPDSGDVWQDPETPLLLAHRRLAILDLSPEGAQPMECHTGRYVICFNGEIYNHLDLRKDLESAGHIFKGRSDTETILAAINHWGQGQSIQKLVGMFAFTLWDRQEKQLHFVRDRMGKKPLYIGWLGTGLDNNRTLAFASELKTLHAHPDFNAQIDKETLALYMRMGNVPAPRCIYKGIWQLPPAHRLTIDTKTIRSGENINALMRPYWSATDTTKLAQSAIDTKTDEQHLDDFEYLLTTCVKQRTLSDVPLSALLSGGIDSALITAIMQNISPSPIKTYSIGFNENGFDEAIHAKDIAAHLGTDHHEHYCSPQDALSVIPMLPDIYDEPFADQSAIPTYLVAKFARQDVTVALSGDGGDELLGGYNRHLNGPKIYNAMRRLPAPLRKALASIITTLTAEQWQALYRSKPLFGQHMRRTASMLEKSSRQDIYHRLLSHWESSPTIEYADIDIKDIIALPTMEGLNFAEHIMLWDTLTYLPNNTLTKLDRASMACSLEARAPLLDHRLYEYAATMPLHLKIQGDTGKYALRKILGRHLPEHLFDQPEQDTSIPLDQWLRTDLRDWAEDLLDETALNQQGLLCAKTIRARWDDHLKNRGNNTNAIWTVLMFQSWHKRWM